MFYKVSWKCCSVIPYFVFILSRSCLLFLSFFSPSFFPLPSSAPRTPPSFPLDTTCVFVCAWSESCMQRSSAPLRTCRWMVRTLASFCSPGVASASLDTSSSESADRPGVSSSPDQLAQAEHAPIEALFPANRLLDYSHPLYPLLNESLMIWDLVQTSHCFNRRRYIISLWMLSSFHEGWSWNALNTYFCMSINRRLCWLGRSCESMSEQHFRIYRKFCRFN